MTPTKPNRRRFVAAAFAFTFVLATAAVVNADEIVGNPQADERLAVLLEDELDEQEALEDEQEDAEEAAEDAAEDAQDAAEDEAEAAEEASDDCTAPEEGTEATFGQEMCAFAQSWKDGDATEAPEGWGEQVSAFARENNPGAEIQAQKAADPDGLPAAARTAIDNAGPDGDGPPGGGPGSGDDDEEEEDEEEEEEENEDEDE